MMRAVNYVPGPAILLCVLCVLTSTAYADMTVDLIYEFDGDSLGAASFGTVKLAQNAVNANFVDLVITANTSALGGGDIHELYFNLPSGITGLAVLPGSEGGTSSRSIGPPSGSAFSVLGPDPGVAGGAGAAFDWGINFGNGGGRCGNGTLTTATFTLKADQVLTVTDFLSEFSAPNNTPEVLLAVHFQGTDAFPLLNPRPDSETVGGGIGFVPIPAPGAAILGLIGLGSLGVIRRRLA